MNIKHKMYFIGVVCALSIFSSVMAQENIVNNNLDFTLDLFNQTIRVTDKSNNIILSPFSIRTCLALAFIGADGKTAEELSTALRLTGGLDKEKTASEYKQLLSSSNVNSLIKIANKIYTQSNVELKSEFNKIATENFQSKAENIDFTKSDEAAKVINTWVDEQTNGKVQNLLEPSALQDTHVLLLNAIYFKGQWKKPFSTYGTQKTKFWNNEENSVDVDMMFIDDDFKYAELIDLDAKAIQLLYNNSDLYMLVIVPNKKTGLKDLEMNLEAIDFNKIEMNMKTFEVSFSLPKFKTEYSVKLNDILQKMGMTEMFTDNSDFKHLTNEKVRIDEIYHKTIIEVDEVGTEAAGATYVKAVTLSLNLNMKFLSADRPFMYFIKDSKTVYFIGRITKF